MLESCVTTQKALSLAWEITAEPAPIATTAIALSSAVSNPKLLNKGATIEAVVMMAMVEEPCAVLMAAANKKGSQIPMLNSDKILARRLAIFEFCKIVPKMPPAPVINKTLAALIIDFPTNPLVENVSCASFFWQ